jgi:hypothetical protein
MPAGGSGRSATRADSQGLGAARAAGRYDPLPCRRLQEFDRRNYTHEIDSNYATCCGTTWDGTYYLTADGTEQMPITIKAAGDGEVVFDGGGNNVLFNMMGGDWHLFENITFRNTTIAIEAGMKNIAGAEGLMIKHSRRSSAQRQACRRGPCQL